MGTKLYPRTRSLLPRLLSALGVWIAIWWLARHAGEAAEALGAPGLEGVVRFGSTLALAVVGLIAAILSFPLLQRYVRRRPTLETREEGLVVALGLGKPQGISWESVAEVRAHRMAGPLKLAWLTVVLKERHRSFGKDVFIPGFFLDRDVDKVVALLEPLVAAAASQPRPKEAPERRRLRGRRR